MQFELSEEFVGRFQHALDAQDSDFILSSLQSVKPADISALLHEFNAAESKYVLDLLSVEIQAEIINDLDADSRSGFLKVYNPVEITSIVNTLPSDDVADILNELPVKKREEVRPR